MSWKSIKSFIAGIMLNVLSIFNRKKRKNVVLTEVTAAVATPIKPPSIETERPAVRVGTVLDITSMLDSEAVELYGRTPYVK